MKWAMKELNKEKKHKSTCNKGQVSRHTFKVRWNK